MDILGWLSGAKTYIVAVVAILAILVNHVWPQPWMNLDPANWLTDIWTWILVITGRSALAQHTEKVVTAVETADKI